MTPAERPLIVLTEEETIALAMRLAVRNLNDCDEWLNWEDVPLLDEDGFDRLTDAMTDVRIELGATWLGCDIDPAFCAGSEDGPDE